MDLHDINLSSITPNKASLYAVERTRGHEFDPEEMVSKEHRKKMFDPRPFEVSDRLGEYALSLPEHHDPMKCYPWKDAFVTEEWFWHQGGISKLEALMWFTLLTDINHLNHDRHNFSIPKEVRFIRKTSLKQFNASIAKERLGAWFEACLGRPCKMRWFSFSPLIRFLSELLDPAEILDMLFELVPAEEVRHFAVHLWMPQDPEAQERVQEVVGKHLGGLDLETSTSVYLAIRVLESLPADQHAVTVVRRVFGNSTWADPEHQRLIRDLVMTIQGQEAFAKWFNQAPSWNLLPEDLPVIFGKGQYDVVAKLCDHVLMHQDDQAMMIALSHDLFRIHCPEMIPAMIELANEGVLANVAYSWLVREGYNAVESAMAFITPMNKRAYVARKLCEEYIQRGHGDLVEKVLDTLSEKDRKKVQPFLEVEEIEHFIEEIVIPGAFYELLAKAEQASFSKDLPPFISAHLIPTLFIQNTSAKEHLAPDVVRTAIVVLSKGTPTVRKEWLEAMDRHITMSSRKEFASFLYHQWVELGEGKTSLWADLLGRWGDDETVVLLQSQVNSLIRARDYKHAASHIEVIAKIETKTALAVLVRFGQVLKNKRLRNLVEKKIEQIQQERGLSKASLMDFAVPACGFDLDSGTHTFDFGPRKFDVHLDTATLKPVLMEQGASKRLKTLPRPKTSDDLEKVTQAKSQWSQMKKELDATIKSQTKRLEAAMISSRRWSPQQFQELFLEHPVMRQLGTHLLFALFDAKGAVENLFRISQEFEVLDQEDEPVDLMANSDLLVGIPHPLELDKTSRAKWTALFVDYEVHSLFAQLDRVFYPTAKEAKDQLNGLIYKVADATTLRGRMTSRGWERMQYRGQWIKQFNDTELLKVQIAPGFSNRWNNDDPPQTLEGIILVPVSNTNTNLAWRVASLVTLNEAILDLRMAFDRGATEEAP